MEFESFRLKERRMASLRRCLILHQGDEPPETPGPLSLGIYVPERKKSVKGSQAAQKPRALDRFLPFRRERGPLGGPVAAAPRNQKLPELSNQKTSCRGDLRRGTTTSGSAMFSCMTCRLKRRSAFSTVSPPWSLTSTKRHLYPAPSFPPASNGLFRGPMS